MRSFSAQKLIAFLLIVFLSGTCCLLCCDLKVIAFAAAESCPGKTHHCPGSAKQETPGNGSLAGSTDQTKTHCPFISRRGDVAQNVKNEIKFAAVLPVKIAPAPVIFARPAFTAGRAYASLIRDRGSIYLANCVFRI